MSEEAARMTCEQFEEILHDMDRPGTSGLALRESALAHAESCSRCGLAMIEAEALDFGLHTVALRDEELKASRQIEAVLLREFRRQQSNTKARSVRWQVAVIGVAAMALLAFGILRARIGLEPSQPVVKTDPSTIPNEQYALENDPQLNELASAEDGTAFVSLPYADDATSVEGGAVVRVLMPRSALISLGLPVSGVIGNDQIPAELVVSADGTPQAIRLISEATDD